MADPDTLTEKISDEVATVLVGMDEYIEYLMIALLTRGHVLLEGVPGVAKTTLASSFANASQLDYTRVQLTPDTLPADITGTRVYQEPIGEFVTREGPIFSNVVVADEINRATPKTQSALLEAMAEERVSIDGDTMSLPEPFLLVATQNPIEMEGTFELPEAQRDRFQLKLTVDMPDPETEQQLLSRIDSAPTMGPDDITPVVERSDIEAAREVVTDVYSSDAVWEYIVEIVSASRDHSDIATGPSPRGSLALLETAKARAAIRGRDYVISDDVKALLKPVLRHRLLLTTEAQLSDIEPESIIADVASSISPPAQKAVSDSFSTGADTDSQTDRADRDGSEPESEDASPVTEADGPLSQYDEHWYRPESETYEFAVRTPEGDQRYYKTREGTETALVRLYAEDTEP
jgi:MoxR-like ATPase